MWTSWSGKLWFIIEYAVNEDLASTADVQLGSRGAVAETFLREIFV